MHIRDAVFQSWARGDLLRVEELLTEETVRPTIPLRHARALVYRALAWCRSKQRDTVVKDTKKVMAYLFGLIPY